MVRKDSGGPPEEFPVRAISLLSLSVFVSVTAEFMPTGLLPQIAQGLGATEAQVGLLVTIFAGTVVVTAMALTAITRRFSRKSLVIAALLVMALSNVAAALAPNFAAMVGARIVGGLSHGLFFALANAYAAYLVPAHRLGRAIAILTAGGTFAFILGVPVGTALGEAFGWRLAFVALAIVVLLLAIGLMVSLPGVNTERILATGEIPVPVRQDPTLPWVVVAAIIVVLVMAGHNTFYVYIAPYLIDAAGFGPDRVAVLLFGYGLAGAVGVVVAGVVGDRYPRGGLIGAVAIAGVAMASLSMLTDIPLAVIVVVMVWAAGFGGIPALLQLRLLRAASVAVRDFASSVLVTAFNVGIGGGALLGALLYDVVGVAALAWVGALALLAAIVVAGVSDAVWRSRESSKRPLGQ